MKALYLVFVAALAGASSYAGTLVGAPSQFGNCIPFSCPIATGATHYEQLYSSTAFPGIIDITAVTFFNTQGFPVGLSGNSYAVSLSTVSTPLGTLSGIIPVGADNVTIFSGLLPTTTLANGTSFTLGGLNSFLYNPANGNLLMNVVVTGNAPDAVFGPIDSSSNGVYDRADTSSFDLNLGLVTQFETATPEPATLWFGIAGAFSLGLLRKVRR